MSNRRVAYVHGMRWQKFTKFLEKILIQGNKIFSLTSPKLFTLFGSRKYSLQRLFCWRGITIKSEPFIYPSTSPIYRENLIHISTNPKSMSILFYWCGIPIVLNIYSYFRPSICMLISFKDNGKQFQKQNDDKDHVGDTCLKNRGCKWINKGLRFNYYTTSAK